MKSILILSFLCQIYFCYSQQSYILDLTKVSKLFNSCDDSVSRNSKYYYIPVSSDNLGINFFKTSIETNLSIGKYSAILSLYDYSDEFLSDIWVNVFDGINEIQLPLCAIIKVFESGDLEKEYLKVFNFLEENLK